jgi:predicted RNase H-like nuclease (RuvC/YqgF family)
MKMWMKGFGLVPALFLAGIPATAQSQDSSQQQTSDPLAEAARKARESKKDTPKPKKVYTDDDLKKSSSDAVSTVGTTSTTTQPTGNATKDDSNGEAAWRAKFKDQHDRIARAEKELEILQRELQKAQLEYYPDPQKAMTEQNTRGEINDKTAKIDAKQKEIAQLKQGLDDLEDQLRKAGGDPGWAR